ncbi:zinc ribbon domain-containing protein [Brevibacterium yomogidense]|uniref:CT398-like coiled coil hairpin domain-containing protein n=1 Tax=Brevibacterium yomogidense TaxID=946573 RepID=A0A1X6X9G1_9MICO|nr:hypothetical protein [Brevibacterium yomogidense]SLM95984.1 Hypothetical protein FM105_05225 [Brevibacterium yomogidense]
MADEHLSEEQAAALREWIAEGSHLRTLQHEAKQTERLEALRALAGEHGELQNERTRLAAVHAEQEKAARDAENSADDVRERVMRTETRLNDGTGLTSRDLMGLQDEIAGLRERIDLIEGEQVEALEAAEETASQLADTTAKAEEVAARGRELQAERASEDERLTGEIAEVEKIRASLLERIPADLHGRLRAEGSYPAAAVVTAGSCGACGEQLSGMLGDTYRNLGPGGMLDCDGCGALLLKIA